MGAKPVVRRGGQVVVSGAGEGVLVAAVITGAACGYLHFWGGSRLAMSVDG